jgi:hypothetical protein
MNKEFVTYEQALALKELGFDEPCIAIYAEPLKQQAFRWLLKEHNIYAIIIPTVTMHWTFKTMTVADGMIEVPPYNHVDAIDYSTYEEAEHACLNKLIEIVKQNGNIRNTIQEL